MPMALPGEDARRVDCSASFTAEVVIVGANAVVTVSGELDVTTIEPLRAVVAGVLAVGGVRRVQIDGHGLGFVDSSGLRGLLLGRADARAAGVEWYLGATSVPLRRLLDLADIGELLTDPDVN